MNTDTYNVIDSVTGITVSQKRGLRKASQDAERRNQKYGAVRFTYRYAAYVNRVTVQPNHTSE